MIDIQIFNKSMVDFDEREKRTGFFKLAKNLIEKGFETEGLLLILTTWNFALFRYAIKSFDIDNFTQTLKKLQPYFLKFKGLDLRTIPLDNYNNEINTIFSSLSQIKGIEFTGASKLMHLKVPDVFIMWDAYIRGEKSKKLYKKLDSFSNGTFKLKKYSKDGMGYLEFLKDMQEKFRDFNIPESKSLAKSIDEFNYVNITLRLQEIEKQGRKNKKNQPIE